MVRELDSDSRKKEYADEYSRPEPRLHLRLPGYNVRSTEINAVIGRSQLPRLDDNVRHRTENLLLFLRHLDPTAYRTDFATEGSSNYAFTLILKEPRPVLCRARDGGAAGGRRRVPPRHGRRRQPSPPAVPAPPARPGGVAKYPHADHVHFFGFYIGNYPSLERERIWQLCDLLNDVAASNREAA